MKIKKYYYCLVDANNKPDFRFIFTDKKQALAKIKEIKNSLQGETLFVAKKKRDFFIDGIKRNFIDKNKKVDIKKGCLVRLKRARVGLIDMIAPETYFETIVKETSKLSLQKESEIAKLAQSWQNSIQRKNKMAGRLASDSQENTDSLKTKTLSLTTKTEQAELATTGLPVSFFNNKSRADQFGQNFSYFEQKEERNISPFSFANLFLKSKAFYVFATLLLMVSFSTVVYSMNVSNRKIKSALEKKQKELISQKTVSVLGSMDVRNLKKTDDNNEEPIDKLVMEVLEKFNRYKEEKLGTALKKILAGTPMEKMVPYIAKKDKVVAAFLVAIAKKESNWGRRVPVLNGQDCYNYWGYRGQRARMGTGGHTCFDSPQDAVETVGGRIERLIKSGVDTPQEMVLWKCGSDCNATGGWAAARKWIRDVDLYYEKTMRVTDKIGGEQ